MIVNQIEKYFNVLAGLRWNSSSVPKKIFVK